MGRDSTSLFSSLGNPRYVVVTGKSNGTRQNKRRKFSQLYLRVLFISYSFSLSYCLDMHQRCLWRPAFEAENCLRQGWRAALQLRKRKQSTATSSSNATPRTPSDPTPTLPPNSPIAPRLDPFTFLAPQLSELRTSLLSMLSSGHPALSEITKYYFRHPSKQVRPVIVLLLSQATNGLGGDWDRKLWESHSTGAGGRVEELNKPLTRPDVLNDWNPSMPDETEPFNSSFPLKPSRTHRDPRPTPPPPEPSPKTRILANTVLPTQLRLAQIVEMMHTASLLHDDVIDASALRRGAPSAPAAFGNKISVLGGNFVLGRASAALSRLGDSEVTELIASVLSNLVEGEILQMREVKLDTDDQLAKEVLERSARSTSGRTSRDAWNIYLQKTYLKTASLMAKGARSAVVLGGCREGEVWKEIAYAYGRNLGIAFQVGRNLIT